MLPLYKKYWRTAFDIALIILTVYLILSLSSYIYNIAKPLFYSFFIFLCIEPLAKRLNKWGVKKSIASGISVLLFSIIMLGAISGVTFLLIKQGEGLVEKIPMYQAIIESNVSVATDKLQQSLTDLPFEIDLTQRLKDLLESTATGLQTVGKALFNGALNYVSTFSSFVMNFVIGVVLAYFLSIEISTWRKAYDSKTPRTFKLAFQFISDNVFKGIARYMKAQIKIMSITFIFILISLILLGVKNAFLISLITAIFDLLPLLGVSTIFIPWIAYLFIVGNTSLAIWLSVVYLLVILTRQILEPKITGDSLGVSAFTMLAFMMISLSLFGIAGVILAPVLIILLKALYDQGYMHKWIRAPLDEFDEPLAASASAHDAGIPPSVPNGPAPSVNIKKQD